MKFQQLVASMAVTLGLIFSNIALAADNSPVLGKWNIDISFQGQSVTIGLTINQDANGLSGSWDSPQGSTPLSAVSFDGSILQFTREGRQGEVTQSFKLEGDTITGTMNTPGGELPVTGKKAS